MPVTYPGAVCEVGITTRRRERPWCKRTRKLADELASSVTFFSGVTPVELRRCTRTNLPANERAAVTLVENVPVVSVLKLDAPDGSASTSTFSPTLWSETLPDRVTLLPKTTLGRETEIVTDCGDAAVPALATSSVTDRAARIMIVLRIKNPFSRI